MNKTRAKDIENLDVLAGIVVAVNERKIAALKYRYGGDR